jgi:S-formylglutathione hydrolase FrmB
MSRILVIAACLAPFAYSAEVAVGVPAHNVQTIKFTSPALNQERAFNLILPLDYDRSSQRYPALYLLHGYGDDNSAWSYMTNLTGYAAHHGVIIVMPDASKSWYVNNAADPKEAFEDFVIKDLIGYVDSHYRTIPLRRARAVAGLSMGGYGAALLGLKHNDKFAAIGVFSGAVAIAHAGLPMKPRNDTERKNMEQMMAHFGAEGSADRKERDPFELAAKIPAAEFPLLYIACGGEDFLVQGNRDFVAVLATLKVPYEYREVSPRVHSWDFWDDQIHIFLDKLDRLEGFPSRQHEPMEDSGPRR